MKINIPDHAFETMKIVSGKYEALELIGGDKEMKELSPEIPFACALSGYGAAVWKIELKIFPKRYRKNKKVQENFEIEIVPLPYN